MDTVVESASAFNQSDNALNMHEQGTQAHATDGSHPESRLVEGDIEQPTNEVSFNIEAYQLENLPHSLETLSPTQNPFQSAFTYHNTPDSGASHGAESLTLKWLDLLIGDATLNYGPLPELDIDPNGTNIFGNSVAQTPIHLDDETTTAANHYGAVTANPYLQERFHRKEGPIVDKQLWQASEPIVLRPQEHLLFRHFTQHISQWVSDWMNNYTETGGHCVADLHHLPRWTYSSHKGRSGLWSLISLYDPNL